jgi:hypothetical protein
MLDKFTEECRLALAKEQQQQQGLRLPMITEDPGRNELYQLQQQVESMNATTQDKAP